MRLSRAVQKEIEKDNERFIQNLKKEAPKHRDTARILLRKDGKAKCRGCKKWFTPKPGASIYHCSKECFKIIFKNAIMVK